MNVLMRLKDETYCIVRNCLWFISFMLMPFNANSQEFKSDDLTSVPLTEELDILEQKKEISLHEILTLATKNNFSLKEAEANIVSKEKDLKLAKNLFKPNISSSASYGYLQQNNAFDNALGSSLDGKTSVLSVNLQQPIFRGFRSRNSVKSARADISLSEQEVRLIEQDVFFEIIVQSINISTNNKIHSLTVENIENLGKQLEATQRRYEVGESTRADVAQASTSLANSEASLEEIEFEISNSRVILSTLVGYEINEEVILPDIPYIPVSYDVILEKALNKHPTILRSIQNEKIADYGLKVSKGERLPSVNFITSYQRDTGPVNFGLFTDNRVTSAASARITVTVPIYQAGNEFVNISKSRNEKNIRALETQRALQEVREDTRIAWSRYYNAKKLLKSREIAAKSAEVAAYDVAVLYSSGESRIIDVIRTEEISLNAKINLARTQSNLRRAAYSILRSAGMLTSDVPLAW